METVKQRLYTEHIQHIKTGQQRQYLECPKHKGNAMRPVEVCYFKCNRYDKCPAVKNAYKAQNEQLNQKGITAQVNEPFT